MRCVLAPAPGGRAVDRLAHLIDARCADRALGLVEPEDHAKALSKAIRRTFGRDTAIQRCQIHKARNILERLPKSMHASVRRILRQAWEMDDAEKLRGERGAADAEKRPRYDQNDKPTQRQWQRHAPASDKKATARTSMAVARKAKPACSTGHAPRCFDILAASG